MAHAVDNVSSTPSIAMMVSSPFSEVAETLFSELPVLPSSTTNGELERTDKGALMERLKEIQAKIDANPSIIEEDDGEGEYFTIEYEGTEEENTEEENTENSIEPGEAYVHGFTEVEPEEPFTEEEIAQIMIDSGEIIPDVEFMKNFLLSHEYDERKKEQFFNYIETLDENSLIAMWQAFKSTYGSSPSVASAIANAKQLISNVEAGTVLSMKNAAAHAELARMGTVYAQLERTLKSASDKPLGTLSVEGLSKTIASLNRDITILNSAIIEMAQMLMLGEVTGEAVDMAVNPERAAKLCAIVGYSAKAWAKVYEQATADRNAFKAEREALQASLKAANEAAANAHAQATKERKALEERVLRADRYMIRNNSGFFLTTINARTEENADFFRISPFNVELTTNEADGFVFDDIEVARQVYDALMVWGKRNIHVRRKFKRMGVNHETLFIAAESMVKVN